MQGFLFLKWIIPAKITTDLNSKSAKSGGYITDDGGASVTSRTIVWGTAIGYNSGPVTQSYCRKQPGFSVRCIRDAE